MKELVSIIIPTYNRSHLIGLTLDSILAQTHTNWECLVIDDGSADDTKEIVEAYIKKDQRFQYHPRPQNRPKGANACRNYGLERAKGTYINWFDSDDTMHPKKLEIQLQILKSEQTNWCICQTQWKEQLTEKDLGLRAKAINSKNPMEDYICFRIFWSILAPLWKKEFLRSNDLWFDEALTQSQEYDFHIKALAIDDKYSHTNTPLAIMYKHQENLSNNWMDNDHKVLSNIKVKQRTLDNYQNRLTYETQLKILEMVTLTFKNLVLERRFDLARQVLKTLKSMLSLVKVGAFKKKLFCFRANLMFCSYRIFGKGYNLLKPLHA